MPIPASILFLILVSTLRQTKKTYGIRFSIAQALTDKERVVFERYEPGGMTAVVSRVLGAGYPRRSAHYNLNTLMKYIEDYYGPPPP